ncbi:hypothetical protein CDL15_Pgr017212 [Punica granatum]|uniref:Uncharacterized protein n=1 Tax=Punica granatum TaxID=22663 RepID=A0A218WWE2_PUNGR|nr:hypothetical protein CDL15_Pgr017212 [Punica granatum]
MRAELQSIREERDRLRCELVDSRAEVADYRDLQTELAQARARVAHLDREMARLSATLDRVYPALLDPGNLPALDLRVVKWQVATPSHVRPSRVPGKVDTLEPRCIGFAHACPDEIKFGAIRVNLTGLEPNDHHSHLRGAIRANPIGLKPNDHHSHLRESLRSREPLTLYQNSIGSHCGDLRP